MSSRIPPTAVEAKRARGVFCNRTLNLRGIKVIGYDMDYTLIHYFMEGWERSAYGYIKSGLIQRGWPVEGFEFDSGLVARGLIIDRELGNLVKANRFGYVKRAAHGTQMLGFDDQRTIYGRTQIDLRDARWVFLNTLFSISEACMYMQCVDLLEAGQLPAGVSYGDVYESIRRSLDAAHAEGKLKAEILADPERFVDLDAEVPLALLDQKMAGKTLLLITNSEFAYAAPMLTFAFDRFLPDDMRWQDLFDASIFASRKPTFFEAPVPAFRVVDETGLLRENPGPMEKGGLYVGGNAAWVERSLNVAGGEILYVGDHLFVDVNVAKSVLRWRTALIIRELDDELAAVEAFEAQQAAILTLMATKEAMEFKYSQLRLDAQRIRRGYGPHSEGNVKDLDSQMTRLRDELRTIDAQIAPMAAAAGKLVNERWGPLFRAGNDKSHLARQVERYADIYTSRVSNFAYMTPFEYLRSPRGSLPHDPAFKPPSEA